MRIAIVDDRTADCVHLREQLLRWAEETGIPLIPPPAVFHSGETLLEQFSPHQYDVIFLDVYMAGINGMETARMIRRTDSRCRLIFTTTSPEFAVDSYEVDSTYYLVKPYPYEKLAAALARCGAAALEQGQVISVPGRNGDEKLLVHSISHAEYAGRKVQVHFKDGGCHTLQMTWGAFSALLLPYPYFCDCMKGVLVNFEAVEKLTDNSFLLRGGRQVSISRLKYREVREQFLEYSYEKVRAGQ